MMSLPLLLFAAFLHAAIGQRCNLKGRCRGTLVNQGAKKTVEECMGFCAQIPDCTMYTYNSFNGICGAVRGDCTDVVSVLQCSKCNKELQGKGK